MNQDWNHEHNMAFLEFIFLDFRDRRWMNRIEPELGLFVREDGLGEGEGKRKDGWFIIPLVFQLTRKGKSKSQSIQIESIENYKQMKV